jgi:hypothetical protein
MDAASDRAAATAAPEVAATMPAFAAGGDIPDTPSADARDEKPRPTASNRTDVIARAPAALAIRETAGRTLHSGDTMILLFSG